MDATYAIKKYDLGKVALLFLFIIALLLASFIVASRSHLVLSGPIILEHFGLSASIPAGNGWRTDKQWKHEESGFTLSSVFIPDSTNPTAFAQCRYLLAPPETTAIMQFEQKAAAAGSTIETTDQIQTDDLAIDWAHIKKQGSLLDIFLGTARLPHNRRLDIEVHHIAGDMDLAEQVFKSIAQSLKFEDNQLMQVGSEVVTEIKNTGLAGLLYGREQQTFFLIKDVKNQSIGFTMDTLIDLGLDAQLNIQAETFFYSRSRRSQQRTLFQSTDNLDEFIWKSETSTASGKTGTEINLSKDGTMTVKKFSLQTDEKHYQLGAAAIPEVLFDQLLVQMLASGREKIIVDIIDADGKITPVFVYREEDENAAYVFELQLLDGRGFSERLYLDSREQIFKILLRQEGLYTLERTDAENILRQFPERAEYILQKSGTLEQNRL